MNRIFILLNMFKLELLIIRGFAYAWISIMKYEYSKSPMRFIRRLVSSYKKSRHYIHLYDREFIYTKHIVLDVHYIKTIGNLFSALVSVAWLCEKMKVNLKIEGVSDFFETNTIINNPLKFRESYFETDRRFLWGPSKLYLLAVRYMSSEYGYKILSQLSIKRELRECADKWFDSHIKRSWTTVHFRGTDCKLSLPDGSRFMAADYVMYLQAILDARYSIFVCSDQAQFIDKMHVAFSGRVYARDIERSNDNRALHYDPEYKGIRQKKDALLDLLILAKADFVYTTGSGFVDAARFLNPSIKIVSLDARWIPKGFSIAKNSPNSAPIPRQDLFGRLTKRYEM